MANNPNTNKVIYAGQTLIDLTQDTVSPEVMLSGSTAHDASGATIQGAIDVILPNAPITSTGSYKITDFTIDGDEIIMTITLA